MVSNSTINYNRPTMSIKVDFYNMLVLYFKVTEGFGTPTDEQRKIAEKINNFGNDNTANVKLWNFRFFDSAKIRNLRPKHHRKARFYNLLVSYADMGRFDVFELLLKSIKAAIAEDRDIEDYEEKIALLGFNQTLDLANFLRENEIMSNNVIVSSSTFFLCHDFAIQIAKDEISKEKKDEDVEKDFTLELHLNMMQQDFDEFIEYLDTLTNVSYVLK